MEQNKRACFALIAATLVNRCSYSIVYDINASSFINISSSGVNSQYLSFFDYSRGGYISGNETSMYDYPTSSYVSIIIRGNEVDCYDYEYCSHVVFRVNGNCVSAHDFQVSFNYEYSIS